uniref:Uncharacterized protein n=1 Tax=Salmo trutta TaxID=8032 RepID=A0A673XNQ0_SALTR
SYCAVYRAPYRVLVFPLYKNTQRHVQYRSAPCVKGHACLHLNGRVWNRSLRHSTRVSVFPSRSNASICGLQLQRNGRCLVFVLEMIQVSLGHQLTGACSQLCSSQSWGSKPFSASQTSI